MIKSIQQWAFRKGGYCSQVYPRATFAAMVYRFDIYVGQIVQKLKELGVYDKTLIIIILPPP